MDFSLKGYQIVAGGRSVAQTTGQQSKNNSGGLRYATTTGYYLTALQAEIRSLRFHTVSTGHESQLQMHGWSAERGLGRNTFRAKLRDWVATL
jgi:hypothetical protein